MVLYQDKAINSGYFCRVYNIASNGSSYKESICLANNSDVYNLAFDVSIGSSGIVVGTGYYSHIGATTVTVVSDKKPVVSACYALTR